MVSQKQKILILRLDGIGDFILWLDSAKEYRKIYPPDQFEIVLLANASWSDVAGQMLYWDRVIPLDRQLFDRNLAYRWDMLRKLRAHGFDIVIQPRFSREFRYEDAIIKSSPAKERIGMDGDLSNINAGQKRRGDRHYTRLIKPGTEGVSELDRNAAFINALLKEGSFVPQRPGLLREMWKDVKSPSIEGPYYVLALGAGWDQKRWPLEYFAALAAKIYKKTGWVGVIGGDGKTDQELSKRLAGMEGLGIKDHVGKFSLQDSIGAIARARFLVGNDSGMAHVAAAVGIPSVCVLGGGQFGRFLPYPSGMKEGAPISVYTQMPCYDCNWRCIHKIHKGRPYPCIQEITVEQVWKQVEALIDHL